MFVVAMIALSAVIAGWEAINRLIKPAPIEHLGWPAAEPVIGLVITVAILLVLRTVTRDVFRRLMDGVDPAVMDTAERSLLDTAGVERIRSLQVRWLGHTLHVETDLEVDPNLTLAEAHEVAHRAEALLLGHLRRVSAVTIHTSHAGAHPAPVLRCQAGRRLSG